MELKEVIESRRSVRHYNNSPITKEEIIDILECGIVSPSAKNRQPWEFVVLHENKELKNSLGEKLYTKMGDTALMTSNVIKESQALVLVFGKIEDEIMDIQSIGACIENMILRAKDLDIASLWIGYILEIEDEIKKEFKNDNKLIAAIALGHTDHYPSKRPRKTLEDCCTWH